INLPTRRQLELLSDDDDDQLPALSSFKRPRISLPVMPNSSASLLSEVSSILDSKGPSRRHPRKSPSPPVTNSNTTTTSATVTPSKAPMFQSNTPISKKERETTVRSILREPNTPGTGQSVRFFSKDAFRVISPNPSTCTSPETSPAFIDEIDQLTNTEEHDDRSDPHPSCSGFGLDSRLNLASKSTSIILPDSSHNGTNLFDMSLDMPAIPTPEDAGNMLSDDAMEVPEFDIAQPDVPSTRRIHVSLTPDNSNGSLQLESNGSFQATKPPARIPSTSTTSPNGPQNITAVPSPSTSDEIRPEPKRYWSTGGLFPTGLFGRRVPSSVTEAQADIIKTLREELNLQKEISSRYQMDLDSRDALVEILSARVEYAETELEQWMSEEDGQYALIQDFKKQLYSLERSCGQLRATAGINRDEELSEISISDAASQQALKTLRNRIKHLEEQNDLLQRESEQNIQALAYARGEVDLLKSHLDQDEYTEGSNILRVLEERSNLREK
ncbi:2253_t:CDS:1, partial [Acaulospora colombiana]